MSRRNRRYLRTVFLGIAAMAALIWSAVDQFGMPWSEVRELMLGAVLAVGVVIIVAGIFTGLWLAVRRFTSGRDDG